MKLRLKEFRNLVIALFCTCTSYAQYTLVGTVTTEDKKPIYKVQVFDQDSGKVVTTSLDGAYSFSTNKNEINFVFYSEEYRIKNIKVNLNDGTNRLDVVLESFSEELSEIEISAQKRKVFELNRLRDVEQTAIYAGKKTEVILVGQATANLASNNARQIYNQVVGLNIFENDDAGLQLNIGGRGLDPNRTSNFNTRQNGYDISADVLGYPESYYSPPAEAIEEIQIVRGAASLQYGTQFGGLVNFVFKKPNPNKTFEFQTRNTLGSNNLFTNFTSVNGTKDKFSYFAFYNFKQGDGFRPNSEFNSKNAFAHFGYEFSSKSKLEAEITYLDYLAQQPGGLTDSMFNEDRLQSNRERNWFQVHWLLYNLKYLYEFSENTKMSLSFFGLNASRKAVGFRDRRPDLSDDGGARELLIGDFNNFGFEFRFLDSYTFLDKKAIYLLGTKFYKADNTSIQGPGSANSDADFTLQTEDFPNYRNQSDFNNPNLNIAFFGENIFYVNDKFSITPGFRVEYIKTGSNGFKKTVNTDAAGNPIGEIEEFEDISKERTFVLFGLGMEYKWNTNIEMYGNISQNYRSITFSDVNIVNPSNAIDENLKDETGFTADIGVRGNFKRYISYDIGTFALFYNDKIDFLSTTIPPVNNAGLLRTNIGDSRVYGIESLLDFNLQRILDINSNYALNYFINSSFISTEYTRVIESGIKGNKMPFVPDVNLKTGIKFGYKNFSSSIQYTHLSQQFTDATNSPGGDPSGVIGEIPAYSVLDFSSSYKFKLFKIEAGVNNLLDEKYFTRRATGYPGPGIIPSAPRTYYVTLEFKI